MYPRILHLYGPVWINSYGLMITIGIMAFLYFTGRHPIRKNIISIDLFSDMIFLGIISALVGGRILFILENLHAFKYDWIEVLYPWVGGLSSLGSVLATLLVMPIFIWRNKIPVVAFLDLVAMHIPLVHAFGRIGCFLAGCCFGRITNSLASIIYTHPDSVAPLNIPLLPTQLYESLGSFLIFFFLRFVLSKRPLKRGQMLCSYLILMSFVRFMADFFRGDWAPLNTSWLPFNVILSFSQFTAIPIFIGASIAFIWLNFRGSNLEDYYENKELYKE